jgi:hypothetical protein
MERSLEESRIYAWNFLDGTKVTATDSIKTFAECIKNDTKDLMQV